MSDWIRRPLPGPNQPQARPNNVGWGPQQPWNWQQRPTLPPAGYPPRYRPLPGRPPSRGSGGLIAAVIAAVVVGGGAIIAVILIVLWVKAQTADPETPTSYPYPSNSASSYPTSYSSSAPSESTGPEPSESSSDLPTTEPSDQPTSEPSDTVPPPSSQPSQPESSSEPSSSAPEPTHSPKPATRPDLRKQHGYQVIPLPEVPNSVSDAAEIVADDNIYEQSVSEHYCSDGPPLDHYPNPTVSDRDMQAWLQRMADCDERFWAGPVKHAGFQATRVVVSLYDGRTTTSPCGTSSETFAAFYCSSNLVLYVGRDLGDSPQNARRYDWGQYWADVAHEYGHHVQARTGVFESAEILETHAGSRGRSNQETRRVELQAQCFSGMAITRVAGMSGQRYAQQVEFEKTRVDTDTHGTGAHQSAWFNQGHEYRDVNQCDTFKVPASDVS